MSLELTSEDKPLSVGLGWENPREVPVGVEDVGKT